MLAQSDRSLVLIVDDDAEIRSLIAQALAAEGLETATAENGEAAFAFLDQTVPDLILLDLMMPGLNGFELCRRIRTALGFAHVPLVAVSALSDPRSRLAAIESGVDDFVRKPFDLLDLVATVRMHLRRSVREQQLNPLSRLPGGPAIEETIRRRLESGEDFALCYIDLDNFKAYNDCYGFVAGDGMIRFLAEILLSTCRSLLGHQGFAGHVGGDDFVVILQRDQVERFCRTLIRKFDNAVGSRYTEEHRRQGYIEVLDRQHQPRRFPLLSLSIAVVVQQGGRLRHPAEFAERAAEIKRFLKTLPGSNFLIDRRVNPPEPAEQRAAPSGQAC